MRVFCWNINGITNTIHLRGLHFRTSDLQRTDHTDTASHCFTQCKLPRGVELNPVLSFSGPINTLLKHAQASSHLHDAQRMRQRACRVEQHLIPEHVQNTPPLLTAKIVKPLPFALHMCNTHVSKIHYGAYENSVISKLSFEKVSRGWAMRLCASRGKKPNNC